MGRQPETVDFNCESCKLKISCTMQMEMSHCSSHPNAQVQKKALRTETYFYAKFQCIQIEYMTPLSDLHSVMSIISPLESY